MLKTTFREFLLRHPDTMFRHHLGGLYDTQGLTNRMSTYLSAEALEDETTGTIYGLYEIARIVDKPISPTWEPDRGYDTLDELIRIITALLNRWPWRKR
jgi:hypothetical protein